VSGERRKERRLSELVAGFQRFKLGEAIEG